MSVHAYRFRWGVLYTTDDRQPTKWFPSTNILGRRARRSLRYWQNCKSRFKITQSAHPNRVSTIFSRISPSIPPSSNNAACPQRRRRRARRSPEYPFCARNTRCASVRNVSSDWSANDGETTRNARSKHGFPVCVTSKIWRLTPLIIDASPFAVSMGGNACLMHKKQGKP